MFEVVGDPKDTASAVALSQKDRYQFEWWALGLADARPAQDKRKGADTGIDCYINFFDEREAKPNGSRERLKLPMGNFGGFTRWWWGAL